MRVLDGLYVPYISDVVSPLVVSITIIFKTNGLLVGTGFALL